MPDLRRSRCRSCGAHRDDCGPISWSGLCRPCGIATVTENIVGLATMSGEPLHRWRRGMARSVGAVLLDELDPQG